MDIATYIGIIFGFGLIAGAIMLDGSLQSFLNIPGLLVVIGGTLAATLINSKFRQVMGAFSVAKNVLIDRSAPLQDTIETIHQMVNIARKEGVLGLENVEVDDPFLARATVMAIDGLDKDFVMSALKTELASVQGRHDRGQQIFRFMASTAPAMGMIGTLIGLVSMLQTLDDPASIGPAMAVALLTTFYGAVLAFLFFGPIAEKLETRSKHELLRGRLLTAGMEAIMNNDNRQITQARLDPYLSPAERAVVTNGIEGGQDPDG